MVPQLTLTCAAALGQANRLTASLGPQPIRMHATLDEGIGLVHAEALSFALTDRMPRPEAQQVTKRLCRDAQEKRVPLAELARADYPDLPPDLFDPARQMGEAPAMARAFAERVAKL